MDPQDSDTAARQRVSPPFLDPPAPLTDPTQFHSFKMGASAPPQSLHTLSKHAHRRSRSRNNSLSSFPLSSSAPSLASSAPDSPPLNANVSSIPPSKRPTSHHRRRSSVSTRHESAELMGVSLPELPTAHSDDNVNLGDKDSIRRRALWALEGKPDLAFPKVEIPDITSPDTAKPFELPTKSSFPPAINSFSGKRDSFGKMFAATTASKDQLGTLVEEEEEEEEDSRCPTGSVQAPKEPKVAADPPARITSRHRPASLNLRPLSLVQGSVVSCVPCNLPTPTLTPGARPNARKPFTSASLDGVVSPNAILSQSDGTASVRQTSPGSDTMSAACDLDKKRRSSISYKRSAEAVPRDVFPLPTPEVTPTEHTFSFTSDQETLIEQPLSAADQHFLFKSHHVLLSRITELERTLKNRASHSPRLSYSSDACVGPTDEMLQLISDLRAERDELKRDVDGWRQRVEDADKQASMLAKRIESERREAWVARSHLSLLEVERADFEKLLQVKEAALARSTTENAVLMRQRDGMQDEITKLNARLKDAGAAIEECARLRTTLEQERTRRKELEKLLDDAGLLNTPKLPHSANGSWRRPPFPTKPVSTRPRGLGFQSIDSESSTTDVESADDSFSKAESTLDAVAEEEVELSDEDNGLAGYEDEEDFDLSFSSPDGSSVGSEDGLDVTSNVPVADIPNRPVSPLPARPTHAPHASLSKTWTFPRGKTVTPVNQEDEVDRFFGCLDDGEGSPPLSEEMDQAAFSSAFRFASDDDELPPFVLPSDVGVVVESTSSRNLSVVPEDEQGGVADSEFIGEEVEGGIRFTFHAPPMICVTPPPDVCITPPPEIRIIPPVETGTTPARMDDSVFSEHCIHELGEDDNVSNFVFPPKVQPERTEPVASSVRSSPPTRAVSFRPSSKTESPPSSIPRAAALRSVSPKMPSKSGRFTAPSAYTTSPSKKTYSSIPLPVTPPKSYSIPTKAQTSSISSKQTDATTSGANSTQGGSATSEVNGWKDPNPSSSGACEYLHVRDTSLSSIMSNPLAARSPFQKLSNFISFSWTPGATTVASHIVPSSAGSLNAQVVDGTASLSGAGDGGTRSGQQRFVPKARQLEKLKSRFNLEKKGGMIPCFMVNACKGCSAGDVYL